MTIKQNDIVKIEKLSQRDVYPIYGSPFNLKEGDICQVLIVDSSDETFPYLLRKDGIRTTLLIVEFFIFIFGIGYLTYNNEINIDKFQIMKYIISIVFPINFCVTYMFLLENVIGKFKAFILSILAILIGLLISIIVSVSMIQIPLIFK